MLTSVAFILCFDMIARAIVPSDLPSHKHTRWFLVHALANAVVAKTAMADVILVANHPMSETLVVPDTVIPVECALLVHLYHAALYSLSTQDRAHHVIFALVMGLPSYIFARRITNVMLFFLSGFPGGLIYVLLFCRRLGVLVEWNEPRVSVCVNCLVRAPGMLWACTCVFLADNATAVPLVVLAIQVSLSASNAIFYATQSWTRYNRYMLRRTSG